MIESFDASKHLARIVGRIVLQLGSTHYFGPDVLNLGCAYRVTGVKGTQQLLVEPLLGAQPKAFVLVGKVVLVCDTEAEAKGVFGAVDNYKQDARALEKRWEDRIGTMLKPVANSKPASAPTGANVRVRRRQ